jgi:hypothetical protein
MVRFCAKNENTLNEVFELPSRKNRTNGTTAITGYRNLVVIAYTVTLSSSRDVVMPAYRW